MLGALLYFRLVSLRGRLASSLRRLRQPKYFASFLVGIAYIYFFFFRRVSAFQPRGSANRYSAFSLNVSLDAVVTIGAGVFLVFILGSAFFSWIKASADARLRFSEAEIAFLFPAPLSRRRLIHFHLLSSQFTILLSAIVLTVILDRWRFFPGNALTHAVGWWLVLSTFTLFGNAMNFAAARLLGFGGSRTRGRALLALTIVALGLARSLWVHAQPPGPAEASSLGGMAAYLAHWIQTGVGPVLLAPFKASIRPFAAESLGGFLRALGPALVAPAVFYFAVLKLEVPFAEGSIAGAARHARSRWARVKTGQAAEPPVARKPRHPPFRLAGSGRPEVAFFWKNLIGIQSWFNLRIFVALLAVVLVAVASARNHADGHAPAGYAPVVLFTAVLGAFYIQLLGPQFVRQDLRSDLLNADILKTYPLAGWQIVLGELFTPLLLLCGLLWLAALAAAWAIFSGFGAAMGYSFGTRAVFIACVVVAIPPVACLELLVPNGAALLFPAWHQNTRTRGGGLEAIGQRLIFVFGQFLAVIVALIPVAVTAFLLTIATAWKIGYTGALLADTLALLIIVGGEISVALWWLGERFEKLDIATELSPNAS